MAIKCRAKEVTSNVKLLIRGQLPELKSEVAEFSSDDIIYH